MKSNLLHTKTSKIKSKIKSKIQDEVDNGILAIHLIKILSPIPA